MRRERGNNSVLEGDSPAETALIWLIGPAVLLYGAYLLCLLYTSDAADEL